MTVDTIYLQTSGNPRKEKKGKSTKSRVKKVCLQQFAVKMNMSWKYEQSA